MHYRFMRLRRSSRGGLVGRVTEDVDERASGSRYIPTCRSFAIEVADGQLAEKGHSFGHFFELSHRLAVADDHQTGI